jgi:hypothetical protein
VSCVVFNAAIKEDKPMAERSDIAGKGNTSYARVGGIIVFTMRANEGAA